MSPWAPRLLLRPRSYRRPACGARRVRPNSVAMADSLIPPLVEQLRFARSEFRRGVRGTPEADGARRLEPMNSIGWIVAHMAWHEQRYWLTRGLGTIPRPELNEIAANGGPATTPSLKAMI